MAQSLIWVRARYWFLDVEGHYYDANIYIRPDEASANWVGAVQFADAMGDILQNMSDCNLNSYDLMLCWREYPYADWIADTPLYKMGVFLLESVSGERYLVQLPSLKPSKLESTGDWAGVRIDQADTDVTAYTNMLIDGDGTVAPCDYSNLDLIQLNEAYMQWRVVGAPGFARG
jgi:hypothetical protein